MSFFPFTNGTRTKRVLFILFYVVAFVPACLVCLYRRIK